MKVGQTVNHVKEKGKYGVVKDVYRLSNPVAKKNEKQYYKVAAVSWVGDPPSCGKDDEASFLWRTSEINVFDCDEEIRRLQQIKDLMASVQRGN